MMWILLFALNASANDEYAAAVSSDVKTVQMSARDLKRLFTLQQATFEDDRTVNLILPEIESPAMAWLADEVLGLSPQLYHRFLLEKAYRSGGTPPSFVASPESETGEAILTVLQTGQYPEERFVVVQIR